MPEFKSKEEYEQWKAEKDKFKKIYPDNELKDAEIESTGGTPRRKDNKIIIILAIIVFTISLMSFFAGRYSVSNKKIVASISTSGNVKEELIDRSFGWGKAPDDINIEAVGVAKGVFKEEYGEYKFPVPAVKLSIRNNGKESLNSFSIYYSFSDIDNNRELGSYGIASGYIEAGWTSKRELFYIQPKIYSELIGQNIPINFRVKAQVYISTKSATKNLYKTIFEPSELNLLPILSC